MEQKDWTGNSKATFATLGASSHSLAERQQQDYYATDPIAAELLLKHEQFSGPIWEPACGEKHLSNVFEQHGYDVRNSDLVQRCDCEQLDFLHANHQPWCGDIITNPPFRYAQQFVEQSLRVVGDGHKVAMFLRIQFLEGKERRRLFDITPPYAVYVFTRRILCAKNGDFASYESSAACYAWFLWQKGVNTEPVIRWI